jgi:DNA-binding response OmpR family regulator
VKTSVLLAEDEIVLQELLQEVLTDAGFEVVVAGDGAQAMGTLDLKPCRFSAVITDINLGAGPDGWAVSQHARVLIPNIPVVYVSGHSLKDWPAKGVPNSLFLPKPFRLSQIVAAVSAVLSSVDGHHIAEA